MLGLLKYELSCLKKITYTFLIFLVIYGIFSIMSKTQMESRLFIIFFSVFFVIGALAQWEQYKWDILAGTLPISRKQIVGSIYILCIGSIVIGSAAAYLTLIPGELAGGHSGSAPQLIFLSAAAALIYISICIPVIICIGAVKGRLVTIGIFMAACILLGAVSEEATGLVTDFIRFIERNQVVLRYTMVLAAAVILLISYLFSVKRYEKKDF